MRVALFIKKFLEPTHHAIALVVQQLVEHRYWVFARRFGFATNFTIENVIETICYDRGFPVELRHLHPDLVHAVFDGNLALRAVVAAKELGLPSILSFHGGFDTKAKIADPLYREITRQCAETAARVTVVSNADAERLRQIGILRPVDVVRVPIDLTRLPSQVRRTPGRLIAIGRLVEKKGFDIALRALSLLPERYRLTIVGEGDCDHAWKQLASELGIEGRVEWTGLLSLDDCLKALSRAWVLIHPGAVGQDGNAEGTPQVVLWAQAIGIPVVCGSSGDLPELVSNDLSGLLVKDCRSENFADAIMRLESPVLQEIVIDNAKELVKVHSIGYVVEKWRQIYLAAASQK